LLSLNLSSNKLILFKKLFIWSFTIRI